MFRTIALPRRAFAVPALLAALALAGCASGQIAQTAQQVSAVSSGNGKVAQLDVLNVQFDSPATGNGYPKGADVPVQMWVSNAGITPDTLTSVSSPAASTGQITGTAVALAQSIVDFGSKYSITLKGLTSPIDYGVPVPVTFTFKSAGSVTINVPVEIPGERTGGRPSIQLAPSPDNSIWESGSAPQGNG